MKIITYEEIEKEGYNKALKDVLKGIKELNKKFPAKEGNAYDNGFEDCSIDIEFLIDKLKK